MIRSQRTLPSSPPESEPFPDRHATFVLRFAVSIFRTVSLCPALGLPRTALDFAMHPAGLYTALRWTLHRTALDFTMHPVGFCFRPVLTVWLCVGFRPALLRLFHSALRGALPIWNSSEPIWNLGRNSLGYLLTARKGSCCVPAACSVPNHEFR